MSLEALRKWRARTQEAIAMELAQLTEELLRLEQRYGALDNEIHRDASVCQLLASQGMTVQSLVVWQEQLASRRSALLQVGGAIRHLTQMWTKTQARLVEAAQDRKLLERCAERQREVHEAWRKRRAQQVIDDTISRRLFLEKRS